MEISSTTVMEISSTTDKEISPATDGEGLAGGGHGDLASALARVCDELRTKEVK